MEMVSACPACLTMITHEDHLFEVKCTECGTRFNPFLSGNEAPGIEPVESPAAGSDMQPAPSGGDFSESNAVFQDIREFGENMNELPAVPAEPVSGSPTPKAATPAPKSAAPMGQECLMTAGDVLQGFQVEAYLPPVSAHSEIDTGQSPLSTVMGALWEQGKAAGANAILSLRWALSPDGTKVIASGTPVRLSKA